MKDFKYHSLYIFFYIFGHLFDVHRLPDLGIAGCKLREHLFVVFNNICTILLPCRCSEFFMKSLVVHKCHCHFLFILYAPKND